MKRLRLLLVFTLLLTLLLMTLFVRATCTPADVGTAGNDTIVCDAANPPAASVEGQDGDDTIIVDSGVTSNGPVGGDYTTAIVGSGDDTIIVNGTVLDAVVGDSYSAGGDGTDVIINNGNVVGEVFGDTGDIGTGSGDDTIVNNGNTPGIYGDSAFGLGTGEDVIVNNGTTLNIYGDSHLGTGTGDDIIVNNGTTTNIYADEAAGTGTGDDTIVNAGSVNNNIVAGGGNDTVVIEGNNAQVGGTIDGGAGYDVLTFDLTSSDPAQLQAWAEQIAAANPNGGTLTFNGHSYTWVNFEELTRIIFTIAPINLPSDPVAVYCSLQGGINTYAIVGQQGYISLNVSAQDLSNGLSSALSINANVQVAASDTSTIYALASGEVQVNNPNGFSFRFIYQGYCGTLPVAQSVTPTPVPVTDLPPYSIVNQPYGG